MDRKQKENLRKRTNREQSKQSDGVGRELTKLDTSNTKYPKEISEVFR